MNVNLLVVLIKPKSKTFINLLNIPNGKILGTARVIKLSDITIKVTSCGFLFLFIKRNIYYHYLNLNNIIKNLLHNLKQYIVSDYLYQFNFKIINIQFSHILPYISTDSLLTGLKNLIASKVLLRQEVYCTIYLSDGQLAEINDFTQITQNNFVLVRIKRSGYVISITKRLKVTGICKSVSAFIYIKKWLNQIYQQLNL